jgi:signal transduction histidine kinase
VLLVGLVVGAAVGAAAVEWIRRSRDRRREALFAFAAHELASPTTGVQLALRNLIQGLFGDVSAEQKKWLEVAHDQTAWLGGLAGDVGDLSHLELGRRLRTSPASYDLSGAASRAVQDAGRLAQRWGVSLELKPSAPLSPARADGDRISRVLWNLVTHALKFSAQKEAVYVCLAETAERVEAIIDWKPVDSAAAPDELLDRFLVSRGGKTLRISGIGLAIAREIADRCGAELRAERRGDRDRFILSLPKS